MNDAGLAKNQDHYNATGQIQPIEVMQVFLTPEQFIGFCRGNVIKYATRAGRKDEVRKEVNKVIQYAIWWGQAMDGKIINPREEQDQQDFNRKHIDSLINRIKYLESILDTIEVWAGTGDNIQISNLVKKALKERMTIHADHCKS